MFLLVLVLSGCYMPSRRLPVGLDPYTGRPYRGHCMDDGYTGRDFAFRTGLVINSKGSGQVSAISDLIGYFLDFSDPRNHDCY